MSKLEIALATISEMLRPMDWTLVGRVSTQQLLVGIEVGCATVRVAASTRVLEYYSSSKLPE